jgi:hypothetical protein
VTAATLVASLHARGVILETRGDRLRVKPASAVTPDEVQALRRLKLEVLRLLTGAEYGAEVLKPSAWSLWPEALAGVGTRRTVPFTPCALCPRRTFASYGAAPLCLDCAIAPTTPAYVAYREALRRVWTLAAEGERAYPAACLAALDELAKRLDDVGEPTATELRRRWEEEWCRETRRCPRCGETGPRHDG